ncbi:MAG: hypothetical protein Q7V01_16865, partial [Vicinamibacterales bacterium]|nr:hypothetical protein [Vicinamibacterales bacterium]
PVTAPADVTIPRTVTDLLAKFGLCLAPDSQSRHEHHVWRLVDESTGVPVRRLPAGLAEALKALAAPRRAPHRRKENAR